MTDTQHVEPATVETRDLFAGFIAAIDRMERHVIEFERASREEVEAR